jgi:hypothetical protein
MKRSDNGTWRDKGDFAFLGTKNVNCDGCLKNKW